MNAKQQPSSTPCTDTVGGSSPLTLDCASRLTELAADSFAQVRKQMLDTRAMAIEADILRLQLGLPLIDLKARPRDRVPVRLRMPAETTFFGMVREGAFTAVLPDLGRQRFAKGDWFILRANDVQVFATGFVSLFAFAMTSEVLKKIVSLAAPTECATLRCFTCPQLKEPTLVRHAGNERLEWLARRVRCNEAARGLDQRFTCEIHCLEWLREVFRQPELTDQRMCGGDCSGREQETLHKIAAYLGANLDADHTLADLSRRFALNEFKLKRGFKAVFGTTVFNYLRDLRMQRAALLLKEEPCSVLEIANAVGYANPSHFARNFKDRIGLLPKAYQQLHRGTSHAEMPAVQSRNNAATAWAS